MDKLDKLLFIQGGKCFFCDGELPRNIASVEHLLPKSLKGNKEQAMSVVEEVQGEMGGNRPSA